MSLQRDPVSVQFDAAAARLLRRAHANRGQWTGTYVKNPTREWMLWAGVRGINLLGPDNAPGGMARTRWCRAFIRAVYYNHKWHYYAGKGLDLADRRVAPYGGNALQYQVGTVRIDPTGRVIGRAVRIRVLAGGQAAQRAADKLPDSKRIYDDSGQPAGRHSDLTDRDW
jgi:hypothetical protein